MKALILAAGFGTRLLPYSRGTPKPLFTLNRRAILDLIIENLERADFDTVIINTHHGHEQIETHLSNQSYGCKVITRFEPQILGTGGAIRNTADLWNDESLLVINADIATDIDLREIYDVHRKHNFPVTLVMHDHERFNMVGVDQRGYVTSFSIDAASPAASPASPPTIPAHSHKVLAFTGIHVLEPSVIDFIPAPGPASIIDVYNTMLQAGEKIKARIVRGHYWQDIGTPHTYRSAAIDYMIPRSFEKVTGKRPPTAPVPQPLEGDGSDRRWYRLKTGKMSMIMVDHGLREEESTWSDADAFAAIGSHLHAKGASVPQIYAFDGFSGLVFMEDLGDYHLFDAIQNKERSELIRLYRHVIDRWLHMALAGAENFDLGWTNQTRRYNRWLILEKVCRYFVEAFAQKYLGWKLTYEELAEDFNRLADISLENVVWGFMHWDLQSRNIMLKGEQAYFIDFQGGRPGPLQYDLASLLIDPYAAMPQDLQDELASYAAQAFAAHTGQDPALLLRGYNYFALNRNMQALGAFGFLSRIKGKKQFEAYIPQAVRTLYYRLSNRTQPPLTELQATVRTMANQLGVELKGN